MTSGQIQGLPDDPALLKAQLTDMVRENERLKQQLFLLRKHKYGASSEQRSSPQGVLEFAKEDLPSDAQPALEEDLPDPHAGKPEAKKAGGRRAAPAHWPRRRIEYPVPEQERMCACCREPMQQIGEDRSEEWEYLPATYEVIEHVRPKYACPRCQEGVKAAELPLKPFEKARPGPGLVAKVIYDKFALHLPLYRQAGECARMGAELSRALLSQWAGQGAERVRCITDFMRKDVLNSAKVHTDDTPVRILEPGKGRTRTARFWVYLGHGEHAHAVFDYTPSRSRDGPARFLKDYPVFCLRNSQLIY